MDFTSDTFPKDSSHRSAAGARGSSSSDSLAADVSSSQNIENNEELEIARLQETKDRLLAHREHLLGQLLKRQKQLVKLQRTSKYQTDEPNREDSSRIQSVFPQDSASLLQLFSKVIPKAISGARQDSSSFRTRSSCKTPSQTEKIDGKSSLEDELASKYDALPLLNQQLRLDTLRRSCPYMMVEEVNLPYTRISYELGPNNSFTLEYELHVDTSTGQLQSLKNIRLPPNIRSKTHTLVEYAESTMNIGYLLFGLSEFSRLCNLRKEVLANMGQAVTGAILNILIVEQTEETIVFEKLFWKFKIEYSVHFDKDMLPLPYSVVLVTLFKNSAKTRDVQPIADALIQEYGVVEGIVQFIKSLYI
ncbi:Ctf19p Ecym_7296 [Eremothecium cymbalariae DBVPG|uniref:Uncharacterized protein n=1 Tax=Eremothecium cymbalariae (strain CBS 270.75 / DBVPG 7215 / KCTC 17166 / NRRL Y-17582) TaxID=931890 RepID=G8JWB9_ERECY|nr:hypothetical protein Ecym_7296 [Eremothecium cymbalariae DBVPG\